MIPLLRCVLLPVEDTTGVLGEFRARFDPQYGKCAIHIPIVFPFQSQVGNEKISEWMDLVCKNRLSFSLKAGPAQILEGRILLPVKSQQKWLVEVHQKLSKKCGTAPNPEFSPHIAIGRALSGEILLEAEKAMRAEMERLPKSMQVNATRMLLEEIGEDDLSHPRHESFFRTADG